MIKILICFDLGYQVENLTEFHDRLVDLFGVGGSVTHNRNGDVTKFDVLLEWGTLRLDLRGRILELYMDSLEYEEALSSETIQDLYRKLRDNEIITGSKPWYLIQRMYYEV